ncbi:MAG: isoprenylcysteine carboxylmethyltransferase family protein [Acidobacteria bacterium]|nr:isoprenylcysteine carboxylmethyltransferase family protein [Acidobacteriota bacterium]
MSEVERPRILPPFWLLGGLGMQWALRTYLPIADFEIPAAETVSRGIGGFALLLFAASAIQFHLHRTTIEPGAVSDALIVRGPYRWSRNPIYLAMALILFAAAIRLSCASAFLPMLGFVWVITTRFIAMEERMLVDRFGAQYVDYCLSVRRWL